MENKIELTYSKRGIPIIIPKIIKDWFFQKNISTKEKKERQTAKILLDYYIKNLEDSGDDVVFSTVDFTKKALGWSRNKVCEGNKILKEIGILEEEIEYENGKISHRRNVIYLDKNPYNGKGLSTSFLEYETAYSRSLSTSFHEYETAYSSHTRDGKKMENKITKAPSNGAISNIDDREDGFTFSSESAFSYNKEEIINNYRYRKNKGLLKCLFKKGNLPISYLTKSVLDSFNEWFTHKSEMGEQYSGPMIKIFCQKILELNIKPEDIPDAVAVAFTLQSAYRKGICIYPKPKSSIPYKKSGSSQSKIKKENDYDTDIIEI